jgi:uncharacterized membrane protein
MRSKFSIAGHPLHPMLVALPIGLFVWTLIADLVYLSTDRDETWYAIAMWSSIAAIVLALIAALPGIGDYLTIVPNSDARSTATAHMALNMIVVLLFAVAAFVMWDDGARDGAELTLVVTIHGIGVGLLAVSGWLGGEMVYKHHLAVVPDDDEHARRESATHRPRLTEEGQPHIARPLPKPPGIQRR